jgi:hypothetical protein
VLRVPVWSTHPENRLVSVLGRAEVPMGRVAESSGCTQLWR